MCGRSSLTKNEKELEKRFNATFYSEDLARYNPLPNYNVAPTHMMPVITNQDPSHINIYKWGLIPFWAKDQKIGSSMINARIETIKEKSTYKSTLQKRRCLVPLDGFYEWKTEGKNKYPFRIQTTDQEIFSCAGMWESWKDPNGLVIHSFTIITLPANDFMSNIHDRMPAILLPEIENLWIESEISISNVDDILIPYPSDKMKMYPVSQNINNVRNQDISLINPIPIQGSLF
jgi:putative SOS response-associated peptidase YedK